MDIKRVTSYGKFRRLFSKIVRGRKFFVNHKKIKSLYYLNVGCGEKIAPGFINLDFYWRPNIDICWDIEKMPYPIESSSLRGIYTEHCIEHISFKACNNNLAEFYRLLKQDGILRMIVPDGEMYFDIYIKQRNGIDVSLPFEETSLTPMMRINSLFRNHGHKVIYDFYTLKLLLKEVGFKKIVKVKYRESRDPKLLLDSIERSVESLYLEAIK